MYDHANDAIEELQIYPPPIPDTSYVRTFQLQHAWGATHPRQTQDGLVTRVTNDMGYAGIVHGDETGRGQLPMHGVARRIKPSWPLQSEVLRRGYRQKIAAAMKKVVNG